MKIKEFFVFGLVLAAIICIAACYFVIDKQSTQIDALQFEADSAKNVLKKWQGQDGKQRAQTTVTQADINALQASQRADIIELRKELGKAFKGLQTATNAQIVTSDSGKGRVTDTLIVTKVTGKTDTVIAKAFNIGDKWLQLKGYVTKDAIDYSYSVKNDIRLITFYEKPKGIKNIFKPSVLQVRMVAENPNTNINSLQTITVKPPAKKWYQTKGFVFAVGVLAGGVVVTGVGVGLK